MAASVTKIDEHKLLHALNKREWCGSTACAKGIAIPHAKIQGLDKSFAILAILQEEVPYHTVDTDYMGVDLALAFFISPKEKAEDVQEMMSLVVHELDNTELANSFRRSWQDSNKLFLILGKLDQLLSEQMKPVVQKEEEQSTTSTIIQFISDAISTITSDKDEREDKPEKIEKSEKSEKTDKSDKTDKGEKSDQGDQGAQGAADADGEEKSESEASSKGKTKEAEGQDPDAATKPEDSNGKTGESQPEAAAAAVDAAAVGAATAVVITSKGKAATKSDGAKEEAQSTTSTIMQLINEAFSTITSDKDDKGSKDEKAGKVEVSIKDSLAANELEDGTHMADSSDAQNTANVGAATADANTKAALVATAGAGHLAAAVVNEDEGQEKKAATTEVALSSKAEASTTSTILQLLSETFGGSKAETAPAPDAAPNESVALKKEADASQTAVSASAAAAAAETMAHSTVETAPAPQQDVINTANAVAESTVAVDATATTTTTTASTAEASKVVDAQAITADIKEEPSVLKRILDVAFGGSAAIATANATAAATTETKDSVPQADSSANTNTIAMPEIVAGGQETVVASGDGSAVSVEAEAAVVVEPTATETATESEATNEAVAQDQAADIVEVATTTATANANVAAEEEKPSVLKRFLNAALGTDASSPTATSEHHDDPNAVEVVEIASDSKADSTELIEPVPVEVDGSALEQAEHTDTISDSESVDATATASASASASASVAATTTDIAGVETTTAVEQSTDQVETKAASDVAEVSAVVEEKPSALKRFLNAALGTEPVTAPTPDLVAAVATTEEPVLEAASAVVESESPTEPIVASSVTAEFEDSAANPATATTATATTSEVEANEVSAPQVEAVDLVVTETSTSKQISSTNSTTIDLNVSTRTGELTKPLLISKAHTVEYVYDGYDSDDVTGLDLDALETAQTSSLMAQAIAADAATSIFADVEDIATDDLTAIDLVALVSGAASVKAEAAGTSIVGEKVSNPNAQIKLGMDLDALIEEVDHSTATATATASDADAGAGAVSAALEQQDIEHQEQATEQQQQIESTTVSEQQELVQEPDSVGTELVAQEADLHPSVQIEQEELGEHGEQVAHEIETEEQVVALEVEAQDEPVLEQHDQHEQAGQQEQLEQSELPVHPELSEFEQPAETHPSNANIELTGFMLEPELEPEVVTDPEKRQDEEPALESAHEQAPSESEQHEAKEHKHEPSLLSRIGKIIAATIDEDGAGVSVSTVTTAQAKEEDHAQSQADSSPVVADRPAESTEVSGMASGAGAVNSEAQEQIVDETSGADAETSSDQAAATEEQDVTVAVVAEAEVDATVATLDDDPNAPLQPPTVEELQKEEEAEAAEAERLKEEKPKKRI